MDPSHGLRWESTCFGYEPRWTVEPSLEIITDLASRHLGEAQACSVKFFGQGAFNKLYTIQYGEDEYMMRVSLPVDPHYKTLSEVATLSFVREKSKIPVPKVVAHDASNDNKLGFEWILMERMPGQSLEERWRSMPWTAKEELVKTVALDLARLFRVRFASIGSLYRGQYCAALSEPSPAGSSGAESYLIGPIVSMHFLWENHVTQDVPRGPFSSSREWLDAKLKFIVNDCERIIAESDDEDEVDDAKEDLALARRISSRMQSTILDEPGTSVTSVLVHDDLNQRNILVDEHGALAAIVGW